MLKIKTKKLNRTQKYKFLGNIFGALGSKVTTYRLYHKRYKNKFSSKLFITMI